MVGFGDEELLGFVFVFGMLGFGFGFDFMDISFFVLGFGYDDYLFYFGSSSSGSGILLEVDEVEFFLRKYLVFILLVMILVSVE